MIFQFRPSLTVIVSGLKFITKFHCKVEHKRHIFVLQSEAVIVKKKYFDVLKLKTGNQQIKEDSAINYRKVFKKLLPFPHRINLTHKICPRVIVKQITFNPNVDIKNRLGFVRKLREALEKVPPDHEFVGLSTCLKVIRYKSRILSMT